MTGLIVALALIVAAFGVGAVFCAPWSPVHKAQEAAKNRMQNTTR